MAIAPNTTFVSGAVLTAAQQNAFGFGVVALSNVTTSVASLQNTEATLATVSWTAIANRNYKISFFCGLVNNPGAVVQNTYIRAETTSGTILTQTEQYINSNQNVVNNILYVGTFTAGTRTIFARGLQTTTASGTTYTAVATRPMTLLVEDIGPA